MSQSEKYYSKVLSISGIGKLGDRRIFRVSGDKEILEYEFDGFVPEGTTVSIYVGDKLLDKRPFKRRMDDFPIVKIYNDMVLEIVVENMDCNMPSDVTCTVWYENSLIWESMGERYVDFLDWKELPDYTFTELILWTTWKDTVNVIILTSGVNEEVVWKYDVTKDAGEILPNRTLEMKNAIDYEHHVHYKRFGDGRIRIIMPVGGKRMGGYSLKTDLEREYRISGLRKINYGYDEKGFYVREL